MHVPDGFLDARTAAATGVLAVAGVAVALDQVRRRLPPRKVPLLGVAAAFVFAAQMLNFPVAGGTSGHLLGGVLAAVLLGPAAAVVALTAVLVVQCLLFGDGGVTALGANVFNMAIVATLGGYAPYRLLRGMLRGDRGRIAAAAFASWCSIVFASIACAGELAASRAVAWNAALPAMAGVHMIIGLGEGMITALVLGAVAAARPDLLDDRSPETSLGWRGFLGFGAVLALGLALFVAPFASPWPDGLERVAEMLGFAHRAGDPHLAAPIPDYALPGIGSPAAATALAGAIGALLVLALSIGLARVLVPASAARKP